MSPINIQHRQTEANETDVPVYGFVADDPNSGQQDDHYPHQL